MKKSAFVFIWLALLSVTIPAQTSRQTRPRIVVTPAPTVDQTDTTVQPSAKRPPVLIGDTKSNNQTPTNGKPGEQIGEDDGEIIKVETNLVTMPVSVLDRSGRFVGGLQKQDFHIFENNSEQKIEYFASVEKPFTVVLMLDVSPSTAYQIEEIQNAAIDFVGQLRADDKVAVIAFDERVHVLSSPTNNRNALRNAIQNAEFGEGTSLYGAVDDVIKRELSRIEGRKAVVLFTDGVDTTSRRATYESTVAETEEIDALFYSVRFDTFMDMQSRNGGGSNYPFPQGRNAGVGGIIGIILGGGNVQIGNGRGGYPRSSGSAGSSRADYETGRRYLEDLARNTGGRMFEANNNLQVAFAGIAEELRRQYTIGYYPETAGQKGERRQIRVRVQRPNLVVKAKNSYIVGERDNKVAGK